MRTRTSTLPSELLAVVADALRVLAHQHRLKIVEILDLQKEAPVHTIVEELRLPQAVVSSHLNKMKRAGLIRADRKGREVWYTIADPSSLTILNCIRKKGR